MARKKDLSSETREKVFPARLRELMETQGTTQPVLADAVNVQRQTISNYVNGQSSPDWETLSKIARFFDTTPDYLLGFTDSYTENKDVQFISDYTGLSVQAVEVLHCLRPEADWPRNIDLFSRLIEIYGPSFLSALGSIRRESDDALSQIEVIRGLPFKAQSPILDRLEERILVALYRYDLLCKAIPDGLRLFSDTALEAIEELRMQNVNRRMKGGSEDGQHLTGSND